ncbi:hypothetical protein [uncultured Cohaesibacter sp.]|uniref:hypothetical protein n=1 Tax=uncultured Cohaesibacter sp. TaxID=1002546 RepID=UPI00292EA66C|nr:hypothetical protein [uncultured Cohaesibacter sp.]
MRLSKHETTPKDRNSKQRLLVFISDRLCQLSGFGEKEKKRAGRMRLKKSVLLIWLVACIAALLFGVGCERKQETKSKAAAEKVEKKPVFEFAGEEIYGDPEIFSTPRLQFAWRAPGLKSKELWSMRLDGSDLRRVVKAALLYSKNATAISHDPVRSPDNRYIVLSMFTSEHDPEAPDRSENQNQNRYYDRRVHPAFCLASGQQVCGVFFRTRHDGIFCGDR